jgi:hypothetical protein
MQTYIVTAVIAAALAYAAVVLMRRVKAFLPNGKCADDCGCSASSDKM